MKLLQDRVALVTGSSRGIGAAIARLFAREGAKVALHGRDQEALSAVQAQVAADGGRAIALTADLTRAAEVESLRAQAEDALGPLDILVANAGGSLTRPGLSLEEIGEDGWRASLDANLTATFLTLKSALPGMKARRRGAILTLSSAAARRPHPQSPIP